MTVAVIAVLTASALRSGSIEVMISTSAVNGIAGVLVTAAAAAWPAVPVPKRHLALLAARGADLRAGKARRAIPMLASPLHQGDLALATGATRRRRSPWSCPRLAGPKGGPPPPWAPATCPVMSTEGFSDSSERQPTTLGPPPADLFDDLAHRHLPEGRVGRDDRGGDRTDRVEEWI